MPDRIHNVVKYASLAASFAVVLTLTPAGAAGQTPAAGQSAGADATVFELDAVVATAARLDEARLSIQPSLGASVYTFSPEALRTIPQGENAPLNQILLQAPGVAQDSFGQVHIRGDHANVQFRINGVQLPEGLSVFGQALQTRFANSMSLLTGALPAQYGFQTAGVLDIQTKTGITNPGLAYSIYGGGFGWLQPSVEYGGRNGAVDWYVSGDYLQNNRGIENPASTFNALHDATRQLHGFAYLSGVLDPDTRVSMIGGAFDGRFQIPNNPGQVPQLGLNVNGLSTFNSSALNENQSESTQFGILSLQKRIDLNNWGDINLQASAFVRNSALGFAPDSLGDLLFNGVTPYARRSNLAEGAQIDASWRINDSHTLRFGLLGQLERTAYNTTSFVLPVDDAGAQTSAVPFGIVDNGSKFGWLGGLYLQDEWRIAPTLTLNYGLRADAVNQYTNEGQISPRVNIVWKPLEGTVFHAGYSRYFVPPPFELVSPTSVALFVNTTAAPSVTQDSIVKAERSNYFDVGFSQVVMPHLTVNLDGYYKQAVNLLDEGQFGAPIILTAFNYANANVGGATFSIAYDDGPLSVYANAAYSRALGTNIVSAQFNFAPDELAYIAQHYIHLDHDQTWTGSGGAAYTFNMGTKYRTKVSIDAVAQSGLRASTDNVPNGASLPAYATFNASVVQKLDLGLEQAAELRFDVLNLGDAIYEIRDGTGVGVGASQYGLRRTFLAGLSQRF
ncbi:TonB-dependent receptor [Methylocapsa palsarum]|uniref:Outer membrane receptor proteins, mostly Fe transport n=1 Tax=Methylocapsa palsarum TaxID=1612308 RepID=A0A1I3XW31_9HYPH|nr:TonB-dependent receptor [Methylocapsa palsarum]SFK23744.1 Outer membrane receptor proteins, mostly Fe transport [Methylocapsa palsarum]